MRIDSSQLSLASAYSFQAEQQFSGTYNAGSASNGASANAPSPSSDVQISTAGQQAAANDPGNMNAVISPQMSIFKSMLEQMLGTSIQSMQFTGDISEEAQSGSAMQIDQNGNTLQGASASYAAEAISLHAKGTLTTADGRTLSFSAGMSLLQVSTSATEAALSNSQGNQTNPGSSPQSAQATPFDTSGWPSLAATSSQQTGSATPQSLTSNASSNANNTSSTNSTDSGAGSGSVIPAEQSPSGIVHFVISLNQMLLQQMNDWLKDRGASHTLPAGNTSSATANSSGASAGSDPVSAHQGASSGTSHGSHSHAGHAHRHPYQQQEPQSATPVGSLNISI